MMDYHYKELAKKALKEIPELTKVYIGKKRPNVPSNIFISYNSEEIVEGTFGLF